MSWYDDALREVERVHRHYLPLLELAQEGRREGERLLRVTWPEVHATHFAKAPQSLAEPEATRADPGDRCRVFQDEEQPCQDAACIAIPAQPKKPRKRRRAARGLSKGQKRVADAVIWNYGNKTAA